MAEVIETEATELPPDVLAQVLQHVDWPPLPMRVRRLATGKQPRNPVEVRSF
jgi:hypothetical protein